MKKSKKQSLTFAPKKIVSGGQTGVDRGGLEAAIALGLDHGGWCPAGRIAEDGSIPSRYAMTETDSSDYPARTEQNIIDSDATLILYEGRLKGGTLLTRKICRRLEKPYLCVRLDSDPQAQVTEWLCETKPGVLNVAGPRESNCVGIAERTEAFLLKVLVAPSTATQ